MGGGARSAPFSDLMSPKRRVCASYWLVARTKPISSIIFVQVRALTEKKKMFLPGENLVDRNGGGGGPNMRGQNWFF